MSKFTGVLAAARGREATEEPAPPVLSAARGRPKGKRSDPAFEQVTAYIRKETYLQTKMSLLQEQNGRDFSQLVEELLGAYLGTQKSGLPATRTAGQ
ncbi:MAG: hypothetical protein ACRDHZ_00680 [Ktedonobacteraceae bacterium]